MSDRNLWNATLILNGLFIIFLNVRFWKATAGHRLLWAVNFVSSLYCFMGFLIISFFYDTIFLPLWYAAKVAFYPYPWMNTVVVGDVLCLLFFISVEFLFLSRIAQRLLRWEMRKNWTGWIMSRKWMAWAPFMSPEVRHILAHMTDVERNKMTELQIFTGLWVAGTYMLIGVLPLGATVLGYALTLVLAAILFSMGFAGLMVWKRKLKQWLYSTAWAKEQELVPRRPKFFALSLW